MIKTHPDVKQEDIFNIFENVRDAVYHIIEKKGATYYGIAVALARITKAIFGNENAVLSLSVYLEGEFGGINGIFIGVPAIVNAQGIRHIIEIPLTIDERNKMHASASQLKEIIDDAFNKLEETH